MTEENLSGLLNYSPVLVSRFILNCLIPSQWLRARLALCIPHKKKQVKSVDVWKYNGFQMTKNNMEKRRIPPFTIL